MVGGQCKEINCKLGLNLINIDFTYTDLLCID